MTASVLATLIRAHGYDDPTVQAALRDYQASRGLKADGIYGPKTRGTMIAEGATDAPPAYYKPPAGTSTAAANAPGAVSKEQATLDAAAALDAVWNDHGGLGELTDSLRSLLLGHVYGESQFGRHIPGLKDTLRGTNNWGSVQSTHSWKAAHQADYFGEVAHLDHRGDGTPYVGYYRIYPNQYEGAKGWLQTVLYSPSDFAAAVHAGPSAYAKYLKAHGYYEAPEDRYTVLLVRGQGDMLRTLQAARSRGLTPADPKQAGFAETPIAVLEERLRTPKGDYSPTLWGTVSQALFASTKADSEGVHWFGKPMLERIEKAVSAAAHGPGPIIAAGVMFAGVVFTASMAARRRAAAERLR
jgi:hypothetical protein